MRSICFAAGIAVFGVLFAAEARGAVVVAGSERSTLLLPAGIRVDPYGNEGYRLSIDGDSIEVEVRAEPLRSFAPMPTPSGHGRFEGAGKATARLASGIAAGSVTQYEAVERILSWIARQIRYELDRSLPQDPESVLMRRSGFCTGVARLAVAMLRSVGIEAREVAGYVVSGTGAGGEFHRWIEVRFPDRGWVFSDPLRSHHFVPATYLRLAGDLADRDASANAVVLTSVSSLREVDVAGSGPAGVRVRSNDGRQRMAALRVEVDDPRAAGALVLSSATRRWEQALKASPWADFVGLEPGEYRVEWIAEDGVVRASREVRFRAPVRAELRLLAASGQEWRETGHP